MQNTAERGDRVQVQCLRLSRRAETDAPRRHSTLEFTVGSREVIPGISQGVVGMAPGDIKQLVISPQDGFGVVRRELIRTVPRQRFADDIELYVGKCLTSKATKSGRRRRVRVVDLNADTVIIDANHPLAGKVLEVEVQLLALDSYSSEYGTSGPASN
jgi:FKBP-type peptidyl-prolyl cis-trans isomerase 2